MAQASYDAYLMRGTVIDCEPRGLSPATGGDLRVWRDGAILCEGGIIRAVGPATELIRDDRAHLPLVDYTGCFVVPGFVDSHCHYPQTDMIASHGADLLTWLERYTFPTEARFSDGDHARQTAGFFLDELLRHGTTTALVMATWTPRMRFLRPRRRGACGLLGGKS